MIGRLRGKFVLVSMLAILLVLAAIFSVIHIATFRGICDQADETLDYIDGNGGAFPIARPAVGDGRSAPEDEAFRAPEDENGPPDRRDGFSPEAPFETRFFIVVTDSGGEILSVDVDSIAAVDAERAAEYAVAVRAKARNRGFYGDYRYLKSAKEDGSVSVLFLDCTRDLNTFYEMLRATLLFGGIGIAVFFVLVVLFSGIVFRPVAEAYRKQKRFITDASHELKTPLTVISACCDVLEIEREESGDEWIGSIREQVAKLTDMTNKLVFLSRADEGTPAVPHSDFSLSEVTEEAVRAFRPVAEAQGKELTAEIGADIPMNGDLPRIRELLSILLDNAMKYSDPSGRIAVTLAPAGKGSVLTVSNTTAGVPKGDLSILFERFYRLDSSRNNETGGNGIGLSVAKAIVEQHGGTISAHSHDGVVILFRIRF